MITKRKLFYLPKDLAEWLDHRAEDNGRTQTAEIVRILRGVQSTEPQKETQE